MSGWPPAHECTFLHKSIFENLHTLFQFTSRHFAIYRSVTLVSSLVSLLPLHSFYTAQQWKKPDIFAKFVSVWRVIQHFPYRMSESILSDELVNVSLLCGYTWFAFLDCPKRFDSDLLWQELSSGSGDVLFTQSKRKRSQKALPAEEEAEPQPLSKSARKKMEQLQVRVCVCDVMCGGSSVIPCL
jgi:hypothetical protein